MKTKSDSKINTTNKMKLVKLDGCKIITVIIVLVGCLYIYYEYHNLFKTITDDYLFQLSNQTENVGNLTTANSEIDATTTSKRIKRFLIFQGSGVVKYPPPTIPLYWWSLYNTSTFAARRNARKRSTEILLNYDKSRSLIYDLLETILQRFGDYGNECLLNVICEVARAPFREDLHANKEETMHMHIKISDPNEAVDDYGRNIYHKLINVIFTPLRLNVDERYINARISGENGANCGETFGKCPFVEQLFIRYTQLI